MKKKDEEQQGIMKESKQHKLKPKLPNQIQQGNKLRQGNNKRRKEGEESAHEDGRMVG